MGKSNIGTRALQLPQESFISEIDFSPGFAIDGFVVSAEHSLFLEGWEFVKVLSFIGAEVYFP